MTSAETRISLDMQDVSSQACVAVRRWDTWRTLVITLTLHGQPYSIAAECSAEFVCRRPNGSILRNPCEIVGDSIHYGFTQLTTSLSGAMDCEVRLLDAAGDLITSPKFQIIVYATMLDNEGDLLLQMEKYVNSRTTWLSATLPTAWFGSGPYTQTVSVPGIPAEAKAVTCWPEWAADAATREKQREAWNAVSRIVPSAGAIAFTCDDDKRLLLVTVC